MKKTTFLIGPVRNVPADMWDFVVSKLEKEGWDVYQPAKHTVQTGDPTGLRICKDNRAAIASRDAVHVIWDGESKGSLFDLGIAFALNKKVFPIQLPSLTEGKSFQNMVTAWAKEKL
jgi:hypothetical protein